MDEKVIVVSKMGYGYEVDNPVQVCGVMDSHRYIELLKHKEGIVVSHNRDGSVYRDDNKIIDVYKVYVKKQGIKDVLEYTIYVDMYNLPQPFKAVDDFEIRDR